MPRETFQQELDQLVADVTELGAEVASSLESAVEAMMSRDAKVVESELGVDARYKARGGTDRTRLHDPQARQAPVARDLRVLHTTRSVTNHLVRSGALVEHICNAIFETAQYDKDEDLEAILTEMAKAARNIFDEGLGIFRDLDVDRARDLQAKDDKVDLLYSEALNLITNPPDEHGVAPEWRMRATQMIHYLERVSDHGVGIGASTVFLVTGERMGDATKQ
jgi:phosphate transport system protein